MDLLAAIVLRQRAPRDINPKDTPERLALNAMSFNSVSSCFDALCAKPLHSTVSLGSLELFSLSTWSALKAGFHS
jgi:hypothetical protein